PQDSSLSGHSSCNAQGRYAHAGIARRSINNAPSGFHEVRPCSRCHSKENLQLIDHSETPLFESHFVKRCNSRSRGIVVEHIDSTESFNGSLHPSLGGLRVSKVDIVSFGMKALFAQFSRGCSGRSWSDVAPNDVGTMLTKESLGCSTLATTRACNEYPFAC